MREHVMARSKFDLGLHEEQRLKRMHVVRKVYDCFHEDAKHEGECACDGMASCTTPLEVRPGWTVLIQREPSP